MSIHPIFTLPIMRISISEIKISRERFREADEQAVEDLCDSMLKFGQLQPIIIDDASELIDGLHRYTAASRLGWTHVDAVNHANVSETLAREIELETNIRRKEMTWQERARAIAEIDRLKRAENPNWGQAQTAAMVGSTRQADVSDALKVTKMMDLFPEIASAKNLSQAMNIVQRKAKLIERTIEADTSAATDNSDIASRINLGDSVEFIKTLPDESLDCIITDPPFGVDYDSRVRGTVGTASAYEDSSESYIRLLGMVPDLYRTLKNDSFCVWFFGMSWYTEVRAAFISAGFTVDDIPIIWDRTDGRTFTNRPDRYFTRGYDVALHAFKGNPQMVQRGKPNIIRIPPVGNAERETLVERPVELYAELIRRLTLPNQVVADFFVGSGSCPAAAALTGRRYIGSELDPTRRAYAINKIAAHTPTRSS